MKSVLVHSFRDKHHNNFVALLMSVASFLHVDTTQASTNDFVFELPRVTVEGKRDKQSSRFENASPPIPLESKFVWTSVLPGIVYGRPIKIGRSLIFTGQARNTDLECQEGWIASVSVANGQLQWLTSASHIYSLCGTSSIYVLDEASILSELKSTNGRVVRSMRLPHLGYQHAFQFRSSIVTISDIGKVTLFDLQRKSAVWSKSFYSGISAFVFAKEERTIVVATQDKVNKIYLPNGQEDLLIKIQGNQCRRITANSKDMFLALRDGYLRAFSKQHYRDSWSRRLALLVDDLIATENILLILGRELCVHPTEELTIVALHAQTGEVCWRISVPFQSDLQMTVIGELLYVGMNGVLCIDIKNGNECGFFPRTPPGRCKVLVALGGRLYFCDSMGTIAQVVISKCVLDREAGR